MSSEEDQQPASSHIDRRSALKKALVVGGVAWSAPVLLSQTVSAQEAACTPKCAPQLNVPVLGQPIKNNCVQGNDTSFGVTVAVLPASVTCGCTGTPIIDPQAISVTDLSSATSSTRDIDQLVTITCPDSTPGDGGCSITATLRFTLTISRHPSGHCAQAGVSVANPRWL